MFFHHRMDSGCDMHLDMLCVCVRERQRHRQRYLKGGAQQDKHKERKR